MQKINECHRKSIMFQKINYYHYYQFYYYYYRQLLSIVNFCIYYNLRYGCYNLHYGCYQFHILEAAIGTCSKIYSLEANAKPTTRAKHSFIVDVGRGLRPPLQQLNYQSRLGFFTSFFTFPTILDKGIVDFITFQQNFSSPQVEWNQIIITTE